VGAVVRAESETFAARLDRVMERVRAASARVGRDPGSVHIVAVAKGFGPDAVEEACRNGIRCIGENRIQEAKHKIPACSSDIDWHMIGHLQSNKARDAVRMFSMIHSVDSWDLLARVDREAAAAGKRIAACLQVNVSGERSKSGMAPDAVAGVFERGASLANVELAGLMTIPPYDPDPEQSRPFFRKLRELRDSCRQYVGGNDLGMSIGMSEDFEVAIEEGAAWIRPGRALFGERPKLVRQPDAEE